MSDQLKTYLRNIKSLDPAKRKSAVEGLSSSDSLEALAALEKTAREDTNIEIRFQAKKALENLRKTLSQSPESQIRPQTASKEAASSELTSSETEKIKAIKAAAAKNSPETLPKLIAQVKKEESAAVRGTALLAIGLLGGVEHLQIFAKYLGDDDPSVRLNCVKALSYMNEKMAFPLFIVALNDKNPQVASRAYGFIRKLGKENIVGLLRKMASGRQLWMRRAAAKAAGKFSAPEVMGVLKQLASENKGNIRNCALKSIKAITERQSRKIAEKEPVGKLKLSMAQSEAEQKILQSDKSVGFIISRDDDSPLNSSDIMVRMDTLQEIINDGDSERLPEVLSRLPVEEDNRVKATILTVIGRLGEDTDLSHIVPYLRHEDRRVRATAVEMTGLMNPDNIVDLLLPFLDDPDNRTAANTIVALGKIPSVDVLPTLQRLSESEDPNYRKSAIYAIAQLEEGKAIPILKALKNDPDSVVAEQATDAMSMLKKFTNQQEKKHTQAPEQKQKAQEKAPKEQDDEKSNKRKKNALDMPSQFDLNQTNYRHCELSSVDVIFPCYYAYACASIIAILLIAIVAVSNKSETVFYSQMLIAFIISIEFVAAAVSLQSGKEWSRQFLLNTTKILKIPILAPKSAEILDHEDTIDLFSSDQTPESAGKIVTAATGILLIIFFILMLL